jgi:hypothetical protein
MCILEDWPDESERRAAAIPRLTVQSKNVLSLYEAEMSMSKVGFD